jgi:transcriptional/translational regulatory protein YebC/TACO1
MHILYIFMCSYVLLKSCLKVTHHQADYELAWMQESVEKFLDALEEIDDVDEIFHNAELPDEDVGDKKA